MKGHLNANHRLGEPLPQRIAIVRALPGLGDLLCLVPALRAMRTALPEARITLISLPWVKTFVQRFSYYLDDWLEFPSWPGIPEVPLSPERIVSFLADAQQLHFDLALQMHGTGTYINSFAMLLGAKFSAGFFPPGQYCPDAERFLPYPSSEPEVRRHLRLLEFLGLPLQGEHLEFPLWQSDWHEFEAIASVRGLKRKNYVCIHPGASVSSRRWSHQQFAIVADALAHRGLRVVLTGTAAEAELTRAVAQAMAFPAVDLAGQTSLGTLAALLKNAQLLVCNDTGVSHLAAALQVNSVVIFSHSDPHRWAPLDRQRHRVVCGYAGENGEMENSGSLGIRGKWGDGKNTLQNPTTPSPRQLPPTAACVLAEALDLLQQEFTYAS